MQHAVFVWDLDESLILLHSLISGQYAAVSGDVLDGQHLAELARRMQALVMKLADDKLFFHEVGTHTTLGAHTPHQEQQRQPPEGGGSNRAHRPCSHCRAAPAQWPVAG